MVSHLRSKVKFPLVNHLLAVEHGICWTVNPRHHRHRHHSSVTKLQRWACLLLKIQGLCIYLLEKRSCFPQFIEHTPPNPPTFTRVLLPVTTKEDRTFTSFCVSLKFPHFTTGSREVASEQEPADSTAAQESLADTLIHSNKFCKRPWAGARAHIGTRRCVTEPGVTARRSVYCHSHKFFLEHCVCKLFMPQKRGTLITSSFTFIWHRVFKLSREWKSSIRVPFITAIP